MADREHAADQAEYSTEAVRWARGKRRRRRVGSGAAAETGCGARCGPIEWRGRAGVDDDGGAAETSSTTADGAAGRG